MHYLIESILKVTESRYSFYNRRYLQIWIELLGVSDFCKSYRAYVVVHLLYVLLFAVLCSVY